MKYIVKNPEPQELLDWKNSDLQYRRGRPKWERIPSATKAIIRESLKDEQGHICCYCERFMQDNDYHIEHIKPKGIPPFEINLADYDNLLCSCQFELIKGEPNHCGNSKASWYDPNLLVTPLDVSCEKKFTYTFDGYINSLDPNDSSAITTIDKLRLGIDKLNALRASVIEPFLDLEDEELIAFVQGYLQDKSLNNGRFNEFYTTIQYLFG